MISGLSRQKLLTAGALLVAVLSGAGMAVQARVNGGLAIEWGSASAAAIWSFGSGCVISIVLVALVPSARAGTRSLFRGLRDGSIPWWALSSGVVGAWVVFAQGLVAAVIGVALFTVAIVAGQSVGSLVLDWRGVAGLPPRRISLARAVGAALGIVAVIVASWGQIGQAGAPLWMYLIPLVAGLAAGWQQAVNGLVRGATRSGLVATAVSFVVGTVLLGLLFLGSLVVDGPVRGRVDSPILLIGGLLAIGFVFGLAVTVRRLGVLLLSLGTIVGQLTGAVVLDLVVPTAGRTLALTTVIGCGIALGAVAIASLRQRTPTTVSTRPE